MNHLILYFLKDCLGQTCLKLLPEEGNYVVLQPSFPTSPLIFPQKVCGRYSPEFYIIISVVDYSSVNEDILFGSGWVILSITWLPQDLKPAISYLSSKELELVHNAFMVSWLAGEASLTCSLIISSTQLDLLNLFILFCFFLFLIVTVGV